MGELTGDAFLVSQGVAFVDVSGADIDPTRTLVGRIDDNAYVLIAAQADSDAIRTILDDFDFAALTETGAPAVVNKPKVTKHRRGRN